MGLRPSNIWPRPKVRPLCGRSARHPLQVCVDNLLGFNSQFNNLHLTDSRIEIALAQAKAAPNWDDAIKAYQGAEAIALADHWVIPLYSGVEPYLVRSGLKVPFSGGTLAYRWEDVR